MRSLFEDSDRAGVEGPGTVAELPRLVEERGLRRVLLVTGRQSFTASGAAAVLPALERVATVRIWSDFSPNPNVDDVVVGVAAAEWFGPEGPDAIVAIGGGSVLDMAKLLAVLQGRSPESIRTAIRTNSVDGRSAALILVPTTSGSGSEATHFAVVYVDGEKFSVAHPAMLPDVVVLDPSLTTSASRYQKATSVIDAIAQAVESHWAKGATEESRRFARAALAELVDSAPGFVEGDDLATARAARGSHLAGRAIDLSKTTAAHALAYGFTSRHGISHGHAVALTLGGFARAHAAAVTSPEAGADPRHAELRRDLEAIAEAIGAGSTDQIGDRLDGLAARLGLELRLGELGIPREALPDMAAAVNQERLSNNPVSFTSDALADLLISRW